uniref:Reverse transcriptase domain-containing protein n=1 Tax=Kryptolebias marmoratus TaxID=37003 RepID=A0A3Q3A4Q3_KRYMA
MLNGSLKVASFNINGVLNPVKRERILSKLRKDKVQVAFLQETHLNDLEHAKLNKQGFKHVYFSSHGSGRRRGMATLISKAVNYEHISEYKDNEGRFVIITGKVEGIVITLLNVYVPPGSDWSFYKQIVDIITTKSKGILICGGDFNVRLNPKIDSSNGKPDPKNMGRRLNTWMSEVGIVDVWREINPKRREYSHYSHAHNVYSRIDYFFMFKGDLSRVDSCEMGPNTLSDHGPVHISFCLNNKKRSTLWRLNSNILNNSAIRDKLKREIDLYLEHNDNEEVTPPIVWDALKAVIRGKIISITSYEKRIRERKLQELEENLKRLQIEHAKSPKDDNIKHKITKLKKELNEINTQEIQKKLIFIKQQYYEVGGKSLKLLSYRLRKQQACRSIHKIRNNVTKATETNLENIKNCFQKYYKTLYSQPQTTSDNQIDFFLEQINLPKITDEQNEKLITKITKEEIQSAIRRTKKGKSPGTDGFTAEWYKIMQDQLIPALEKTFNWVLGNKEIPPSWREAVISVLPKEGKDKLECGSYRPVSLLNNDYKLFTSILSKRIEVILPDLIHTDQTGFVRQRQTQDNVRKTLHVMREVTQQKLEALILSLDAEKAFDSVGWSFLYRVLSKFGFHTTIIDTFKSLYNKPTARIKINGDLTNSFTLERGTRQGCCASPLLFALFIEPVAQLIRQRSDIRGVTMTSGEQKLSLFADDLLINITQPTQTIPKLMKLLEEFSSISGYKINISKTQVLTFNYDPPSSFKTMYNWKWDSESIKYLGVLLPRDLSKLSEINYGPLNVKIKSDLHRWNVIPFLSLSSRIESIRMNILPQLLYLFQCLPVRIPANQFLEWDRLIARYVWQGKKARIKFKTLQLKKEKGGMGLPCLQDYYHAAQLRPLVCLCSPSYTAAWKEIEGTAIRGIPIAALLSDHKLQEELQIPEDSISGSFLKPWQEIAKICRIGEVSKFLRWCAYDSDFTPNKIDNRFKTWVSKGLTNYYSFVHKGIFKSFEALQKDHGLEKEDFFRYLQVRHYFNKNLKDLLGRSGSSFMEAFLSLIKPRSDCKIISKLYQATQLCKQENTEYIKKKWEKEMNVIISQEGWEEICQLPWVSTGSNTWREFCWKNVTRFFVTPVQRRFTTNGDACWRLCGFNGADHLHVFWDCQVLRPYWEEIHKHIGNVFNVNLQFKCETLYLGNLQLNTWTNKDKKLLAILLAASKKAITRKWLKSDPPTVDEWIEIVYQIYVMEKITFSLRVEREKFYKIWSKWTEYVKPVRSEFI